MNLNKIIIFCDGASKGNPGRGGWGAVIVSSDTVVELGGSQINTTNNRMELQAAISALQIIKEKNSDVSIYTDSKYVVNGITEWVYSWEKRNWVTAKKEAVLNKDLWEDLLDLVRSRGEIKWKLLSGHIGIVGNERVDKIASLFAEGKFPDLWRGTLKDYKIDILDIKHDEHKKSLKKLSKKKNNFKAYSYVSLVKGIVKTHKTWEVCEKRVKGVSGAKFKKVASLEEEKGLVSLWKK
ncbi:MAG: ribonuclease HI [Parcubacteria group bacterium]|nr:ribonuclease HI [Parcubacteria group bacterium]